MVINLEINNHHKDSIHGNETVKDIESPVKIASPLLIRNHEGASLDNNRQWTSSNKPMDDMVIFDDNTRNPTLNLNNTRDASAVDSPRNLPRQVAITTQPNSRKSKRKMKSRGRSNSKSKDFNMHSNLQSVDRKLRKSKSRS